MAIERINPQGLFRLHGYSHAVLASGRKTLYVGGQTAYDENLQLIGEGDYLAQMVAALRHVKIAIEAAGGSLDDLVSSTVFIRDISEATAAEFFHALAIANDGEAFPAHAFSLIGVQGLAGAKTLVEISAIAVLD